MRRAIALLLALLPAPLLAQVQVQVQEPGFQIAPAVTLSQVYDDAYAGPGTTAFAGLLTQASPRVTLGYRTQQVTLVGRGALDVQAFDSQPTQATPLLRWTGDAELTAAASERLTLSVRGSLFDTNTPRDANVATGFDPGLTRLESGSAAVAAAWRFTELARASVTAGYDSSSEAGLVISQESLQLSLHQQLSQRDGGRFDVVVRNFVFSGHFTDLVTAPLLGWDHRLSRDLSLELLGGPRLTAGALEGFEGSAALVWEGERLHLAFSFASTESAVPGLLGLIDTTSASALIAFRPGQGLLLSAAPAVYVNNGAPMQGRVFELRLDAVRALNDWLALVASYNFTAQSAAFADTGMVPSTSLHHQFIVGVSWSALAGPAQLEGRPAVGGWTTPGSPVRP
jgi:hypothetical protein